MSLVENGMDHFRAEGLLRLTLVTQKIARCLASDAGLRVNEFHCMMQLYLEKPCCVRSLTEILGIGSTSTSKLLRSLDKKGWITRSLDESDRRKEVVALTPPGTEVIQRIMQAADAAARSLIEQLPLDRREPFTECVHTVTKHIKTLSNHT
jgi:DNA-binding MarR family transcriptional regulator